MGPIAGQDGRYGGGDVGAPARLGLEEELGRVDRDQDDAGVRVQAPVGAGVVVDVFGHGVHPGAEEDGCWC